MRLYYRFFLKTRHLPQIICFLHVLSMNLRKDTIAAVCLGESLGGRPGKTGVVSVGRQGLLVWEDRGC